jgi:hypothetical protein
MYKKTFHMEGFIIIGFKNLQLFTAPSNSAPALNFTTFLAAI